MCRNRAEPARSLYRIVDTFSVCLFAKPSAVCQDVDKLGLIARRVLIPIPFI